MTYTLPHTYTYQPHPVTGSPEIKQGIRKREERTQMNTRSTRDKFRMKDEASLEDEGSGLTKREYAAIMAMQGWRAANASKEVDVGLGMMRNFSLSAEEITKLAITDADELLKQLEHGNP